MPPFLAAITAVAASFAIVLSAAFRIHTMVAPVSDNLFGAATACSLVLLSFALYFLFVRRGPHAPNLFQFFRRTPRQAPIPRASYPHPDQLAYAADPRATVTCPHLQPVERALRAAGIDVRMSYPGPYTPAITAYCRIHEPTIRQAFSLPASVYYREIYQPERAHNDNPRADLICQQCQETNRPGSDIIFLHPDEWRDDTPWFPTTP